MVAKGLVVGSCILMADVDRCWCGHLKHFHTSLFVTDICRWCTKLEQGDPTFNFTPRHQFMRQGPITEDIAEVIAGQIRSQVRGEGKIGWLRGRSDGST